MTVGEIKRILGPVPDDVPVEFDCCMTVAHHLDPRPQPGIEISYIPSENVVQWAIVSGPGSDELEVL